MARSAGSFDRQERLSNVYDRRKKRFEKITESQQKTSIGSINNLDEVTDHIYTDDEIKRFSMISAIDNHPLAKKPTNMRSKIAYKEIMEHVNISPKYMLPGMIAVFGYRQPKMKNELLYYDATPCVIFFGITRTNEGTIREIGFNLHYFPPFTRARILEIVYSVFKQYYIKYFNEVPKRPNKMVNYNVLRKMLSRYGIEFGLRMYIPMLRSKTYILPTRLVPTAAYTEGHFNGATLGAIRKYWSKFLHK